jgi:hypothetical protein
MADKPGRMRGAISEISSTYRPGGAGAGIIGGITDMATVYGTRKLISLAWTRATGKQPPSVDDLQVRLPEALAWAIITGMTISAARLLASRALARQLHGGADGGGTA